MTATWGFLIISQVYTAAGDVKWAVVYFAAAVVTLVLDEVREQHR